MRKLDAMGSWRDIAVPSVVASWHAACDAGARFLFPKTLAKVSRPDGRYWCRMFSKDSKMIKNAIANLWDNFASRTLVLFVVFAAGPFYFLTYVAGGLS